MKIRRVGVDLAKNVIHVHGVDRQEKVVWRRQLRRASWLNVLREKVEPGCEIGMEACAGAHHWARKLQGVRHGDQADGATVCEEQQERSQRRRGDL